MFTYRTIALAALLVTLAAAAQARPQDQPKEVTANEFRKAVPIFMDDPASDKGKAAAKTILLFAIQSKDVEVVVGKEESEWFGLKKDGKDDKSGAYMTAYVAGSSLAQVDAKKTGHDPHAGLLQVFKVYEKFQKADKEYKSPELDKLRAKEKDGKLKAYLEEIKKNRAKEKDK
jgi:hypothetical protein